MENDIDLCLNVGYVSMPKIYKQYTCSLYSYLHHFFALIYIAKINA